MMKTSVIIIVTLLFSANAYSVTIHDLFAALKKQPVTKINQLDTKKAKLMHDKIVSNFYPKIYGISSYEHYNSPTNLRPTTPTESSVIMKQKGPLPFSYDIKKIGVQITMPIFVPSLFSLSKKTSLMYKSAKEKERLNLLKNEAAIICANANLRYLESLKKALNAKRQSLQTMLEHINIGVKNGRIPEIQAVKIMENINQINLQKQKIKENIVNIRSLIENLTSVKLKHSINMQIKKDILKNQMFALKPVKLFAQAQRYSLEAKRAEVLPKVVLQSNIFRNFGKGYNNDEHVHRNYAGVSLYLKMPLFDKTVITDIQQAEVDYSKSKTNVEKVRLELENEAQSLSSNLAIVNSSIRIAEKSVKNQEELLRYAKVAFKTKRMIEEEYLRYEDAMLSAKANLYNLEAKKWEIFAKLAVIYGNNLERMVK